VSLYDKQAMGTGIVFVSKAGATWHAQQNGIETFCAHRYDESWVRKIGPLARHRICEHCLTDSRLVAS